MRSGLIIIAYMLAACSGKAQEAERRYEIVKKNGSATAICAEGKNVLSAYLEDNDEAKYAERRQMIVIECYAAQTAEGKTGDIGEIEDALSRH